MQTNRTKGPLATLGVVALLGLSLLPGLVGAAGAAPAMPASAASVSASWAYGGQGGSSGSQPYGLYNISWNASFGLVAVFTATNTSNTTIELTEERTVALAISLSASGSSGSFQYHLRAVEVNNATVNLTRAASVIYTSNNTSAPALGLLNASAHTYASLQESLTGAVTTPNGSVPFSAYLNATGRAQVAVTFTPALGLLPETLGSHAAAWSSSSLLSAVGSWSVGYNWSRHGPVGSTGSNGSANGSLNQSVYVILYGSTGTSTTFHDGRARTQVVLHLLGPFGLHDGFVLIPVGFDFFSGGAHPYDAEAIGQASVSSEAVYVLGGQLDVRSVSAAQATSGSSGIPLARVGASGTVTAAVGTIPQPGTTVTAQPESASQGRAQAVCLQTGCPSAAPGGFGLLLLGVLVAAAAVACTVWAVRRRPRSPTQSPAAIPPGVYGVTAPASTGPNSEAPGTGNVGGAP